MAGMIRTFLKAKLLKSAATMAIAYLSQKSTQKKVARIAKNVLNTAVTVLENRVGDVVAGSKKKRKRVRHA
jgi:hypothetical protein